MFSTTNNAHSNKEAVNKLFAKFSDAEKYKESSKKVEFNSKSYSEEITKKLITKVKASLS